MPLQRHLFLISILCTSLAPTASHTALGQDTGTFRSDWPEDVQRQWVGPEFWANRLQDWRFVEDGQVKPVVSGGEEDVMHLVLRLAISQMVAERAGQPLSLLVLDEIFGSLDEHRRQNVVELLRGLADRFPQVVLITHIDSVRDSVDRVLRVELDQTVGAAVVSEDHLELGSGNAAA